MNKITQFILVSSLFTLVSSYIMIDNVNQIYLLTENLSCTTSGQEWHEILDGIGWFEIVNTAIVFGYCIIQFSFSYETLKEIKK